jgi:hypothetical protein
MRAEDIDFRWMRLCGLKGAIILKKSRASRDRTPLDGISPLVGSGRKESYGGRQRKEKVKLPINWHCQRHGSGDPTWRFQLTFGLHRTPPPTRIARSPYTQVKTTAAGDRLEAPSSDDSVELFRGRRMPSASTFEILNVLTRRLMRYHLTLARSSSFMPFKHQFPVQRPHPFLQPTQRTQSKLSPNLLSSQIPTLEGRPTLTQQLTQSEVRRSHFSSFH